ncbi:M14 family metallopeptidase [Nocardioides sp. GCM10027113]|uniref:M14 family metallopeptidase n=1 Tax=unclassified Nocardioides TaxID=2615069 RepID=UPI0036078072
MSRSLFRKASRRPTRAVLTGALTATALAAGALALPASSGTAVAKSDFFAPQLVTVDTPLRADKERLQTLGLDLTEHAGHDYIEVVLHTREDLSRLTAAGFEYDVEIPDLIARGIEIAEINEAYAASVAVSPLPSGRTSYRTLADYNTEMAQLAEANPDLVKSFELPHQTLDGRTVNAIEIGAQVAEPLEGQPTFLLMGLHHAREWPSGELAMEFAHDLVRNFGKDERITGLLEQARVVVVPVVNPDGFHLSRTDGEYVDLREANAYDPLGGQTSILATPGQAYKRKNCRLVDGQDTPDGSCAATLNSNGGFGLGVDLNRNYGGLWGGPGASGSDPDAGEVETGRVDPTYRGPEAFSEPETQNIREFVKSRQVTMLISNHTFSNLVLRPNGVNPSTIGPDGKPVGDAPDEEALKEVGARMTAQNGYQNIHGWQLYDTTGTTEDWSYNATGGFGYTFEIGPDEFHPPFPHVIDEYLGAGEYEGRGNREAYLIALEHAVDERYSGTVTGKAPKGAVLRLQKTFQTPTWEGFIEDGVDTAIEASGRFSWLVNPSTRPVVQSRTYQVLNEKPYREQVFEGGAITPTDHVDHEFTIGQDADMWRTTLDWSTPDDLDLEIYRRKADGTLENVGGSGNMPGEKEQADVPNATAGDYVLRVINYASVTPDYTLTTGLYAARTERTEGKRELYTLTCEKPGGKVLQTEQLFIDRGQEVQVNLKQCRNEWSDGKKKNKKGKKKHKK